MRRHYASSKVTDSQVVFGVSSSDTSDKCFIIRSASSHLGEGQFNSRFKHSKINTKMGRLVRHIVMCVPVLPLVFLHVALVLSMSILELFHLSEAEHIARTDARVTVVDGMTAVATHTAMPYHVV